VRRAGACALLAYALSSLADAALTLRMASLGFAELNPFTRALLPHPHLLAAREAVAFALACALYALASRLPHAGGRAWAVPAAMAAARALAALHNLLLLLLGWSPLEPLLPR